MAFTILALPASSRALLISLILVSTTVFFLKLTNYRAELALNPSTDVKFHDILVPYLQLVPRHTLTHPWVILTSIFAEISVIPFAFSTVIIATSTRFVERFWGPREVVKFVLLVGTITNLLTVLTTITFSIFRGDISGMDKPLGGGISYYFGFLVVLKQLIPEHNIVLFQGKINIRVKHFPFVLIVIILIWSLVFRSLYPFVPSISSFFISYVYLRWFQSFVLDPLLPLSEGTSTVHTSIIVGDASDTFQLVEFFPAILKPYLSGAFGYVYDIAVYLGVLTAFDEESIEQSNLRSRKRQEQTNKTQKSVANSVAERRRQVALQVIEDRINKERK